MCGVQAMTRDELVLHEAEGWSTDGFSPIPVHAGSKKPVGDGWQHQRLTLVDLPSKFEKGSNVGVLLGIRPRVIVDVDCDSPEAIACAKLIRRPRHAPELLFGRRSKPCSHYLFELGAEFETMQFKDLDGKMIAEMRGKAGNGNPQQTVVPGSMHQTFDDCRLGREKRLRKNDRPRTLQVGGKYSERRDAREVLASSRRTPRPDTRAGRLVRNKRLGQGVRTGAVPGRRRCSGRP